MSGRASDLQHSRWIRERFGGLSVCECVPSGRVGEEGRWGRSWPREPGGGVGHVEVEKLNW